jgi:imidazolonepropionase
LAKHDTVATLVPGANYFLGLKEYPRARKMIDAGVPVALATDYNPGTSPTLSMPMAMSLAMHAHEDVAAEAIAAATINGAWALRLADRKGSIEAGKDADFRRFCGRRLSRDSVLVRSEPMRSMTVMNGAVTYPH